MIPSSVVVSTVNPEPEPPVVVSPIIDEYPVPAAESVKLSMIPVSVVVLTVRPRPKPPVVVAPTVGEYPVPGTVKVTAFAPPT